MLRLTTLAALFMISAASFAAEPSAFYNQLYKGNTPKGAILENKGQILSTSHQQVPAVQASIDLAGYKVYFQNNKVSYVLLHSEPSQATGIEKQEIAGPMSMFRFDMVFEGANPAAKVVLEEQKVTRYNYLNASQAKQEITGVSSYSRIRYTNLYPSIDVVFYSQDGKSLKYDIVAFPGADLSLMKWHYDGATKVNLEKGKTLHIETTLGEVQDAVPMSFYTDASGSERIATEATLQLEASTKTISIHAPVNRAKTLVIDPWATYLGGSGQDFSYGSCVDGSGNMYSIGSTTSSDFPNTVGFFQSMLGGGTDAFLSQHNASGVLQWATYIGGAGTDQGNGIALASNGDLLIAGETNGVILTGSSSGNTVYSASNGGGFDAFVGRFTNAGARLWLTYIGGAGDDKGKSIAGDNSGNAIMVGYAASTSTNYPVTGTPAQGTLGGGQDIVISKFSSTGALTYSTFLGGTGNDLGMGVSADNFGNFYLTGIAALGFPASAITGNTCAYPALSGTGTDAFVAKFNASGVKQWSTFLGSTATDQGLAIKATSNGMVYVAGYTNVAAGTGFPNTTGAALSGQNDAFLSKFNSLGTLVWSTLKGGSLQDFAYGVTCDGPAVYMVGSTTSTNFPVSVGAFQTSPGGASDAFICKFDTSTAATTWSTYYGGASADKAWNVCAYNTTSVNVGGSTQSIAFPTASPQQAAIGGGVAGTEDAFALSMNADGTLPAGCLAPGTPTLPSGLNVLCQGLGGTYTTTAVSGATSYIWSLPSGWTGTSTTTTISATAGASSGTVCVSASNGTCSSAPSCLNITVNTPPTITVQPVAQSACTGGSVTFSVGATGSTLSYQWRKGTTNVSGTNITGANSATLVINPVGAGDVAPDYNVLITGTCTPSTATSVSVALSASTGATISSQPTSQTVCAGSNVTLNVTAAGATAYQWIKGGVNMSNGGTASGVTTSSLVLTGVSAADAAAYTVSVTGGCGSPTASSTANLVVNALPAISLQPTSQTICAGSPVTFSSGATGAGLSYQWKKGATNMVNGGNVSGALTSTLILNTTSGTDAATYTLVVTGTCLPTATSAAATLTVTSSPSIATQPTAQTVCSGSAVTISMTATNGVSYQWRKGTSNLVNGGAISGATSNTLVINPVAGTDAATNYNCVVTGACAPTANTNAVALVVNPVQTLTLGASPTFCAGNAATIGSSSSAGNTYLWSPATGLSSATISNPSANPTNTTVYTLTQTNTTNGCTSTGSVTVNVNPLPAATTGSSPNICAGNAATIGSANAAGSTYSWTPTTGLSSSTVSNPSANPTNTTTYTLTQTITATGCSKNGFVTVNVNPLPAANAGAAAFICGGTSATLGAASVAGSSYSWTPTTGLSSATVSNPVVTATTATTYTLTQTVTATGCSNSNTVDVSITSAPTAFAGNDITICQGTSITLGGSSTGGMTYSWTPSSTLSGATTSDPVATPSSTTNYVVTQSAGGSCTDTDSVLVTVKIAPLIPVITISGSTLVCSIPGLTYQWFLDGIAITGATAQTYVPTANGVYTVEAFNSNGCSTTSLNFNFSTLGMHHVSTSLNARIEAFPNPFSEQTSFVFSSRIGGPAQLELFDATGKSIAVVFEGALSPGQTQEITLDGASYPTGIYIYRLQIGSDCIHGKLSVIR